MYKSSIGLIAILAMSAPLATVVMSPAQALSEAQVLEKLQEIPVFTITDKNKNLLQQSVGKAPNVKLFSPVYIEQGDAQTFVNKLKKDGSPNGKLAQITIVPLSAVYKMQLESEKKPNGINFLLFPNEQQVKNAQILKNKPYQFNSLYPVPLFTVAIKQKDKYVTVQQNKLTPLFFDKQQAQQWLERVKKVDPKLVANAEIKVNYLHSVLKDFNDRTYPEQQQFTFVPSTKNVEIIRKIQAQQQTKPGATTPSPAGTPKK
jgi:nickel transport protein